MCIECESDIHLKAKCDIFLTVQDQGTLNRVLVGISEKVSSFAVPPAYHSTHCPLLLLQSLLFQDIPLLDFLDNPSVMQGVKQRLKVLVGSFYPNNAAPKELPSGATASMEVIAWLDDEGDVAFSLLTATVI